jgi:hypothetical protein
MTVVQRLVREPNLVLGVLTTGLALAVLFGADLSTEQMAGIGAFVGALIILIRFITTPSSEVVVQEKPSGELVAGPAAPVTTGNPVLVDVRDAA